MARRDNYPFAPPPRRQGGAGNVLAAVASAVIPGLGQLAQARLGPAIFFFLVDVVLWAIFSVLCIPWVALVMHVWAALDAAWWEPA